MSDPQFKALLITHAKLYRPTTASTPNEFGERRVEPGSVLVSDLMISLQPLREKLQIDVGGFSYLIELAAYMEITDIQDRDILEVGSIRYRVYGVEDEAGRGHHLKVLLSKES